MKPLYLILEDGAVFEGKSVNEAHECAGLLSFYTGVVGYQEVITDPANLGKIVVFTYPLIGNYGVNSEDAESASPKVAGVIVKEYSPYHSNFRAEGSLADYLSPSPHPATLLRMPSPAGGEGADASAACNAPAFGQGFDTRAILLHMRENGEMKAVISGERLDQAAVAGRIAEIAHPDYEPENSPMSCENARLSAAVLDLGASRSFYKQMVRFGICTGLDPNDADIIIVSDAPYYLVEDSDLISQVKGWIGKKTIIGFGHGSAIVARAVGAKASWMEFGHHGVNIPVRYSGGGRNEITVQNHNYIVKPEGSVEALFTNVHDGTCEGFVDRSARAAGANFVPTSAWFGALLKAVEVNYDA